MSIFSQYLKKLELVSSVYISFFLLCLTFVIYSNTLVNGLFFDDEHFIYNNQLVKAFNFPGIFTQSISKGDGFSTNYYRPLLLLSFTLEYKLFGNAGFIYHFMSILFHASGGIVLYLLLLKISKNKIISLITSLLFLIHPLQTEAVAYASGRGDPMSVFFILLTILFSFQGKKRFFSMFFLICALLSKETAIITPILMFISHLTERKDLSIQTVKEVFKKALPSIGIVLFYIFLRLTIFNFADTLNFQQEHNSYTDNIFVRINTFFWLLPSYIGLLLYPKDLFMERDQLVSFQTSFSFSASISILLMFSFFLLAIKYFKKNALFFFSISWFYANFILFSGILIPINGYFYEHYLYAASIGVFLCIALGINKVITYEQQNVIRIFTLTIFSFILVFFIYRTWIRNFEWHDPKTFYEQTLRHIKSPRIYNNLGMAYSEEGQTDKAIAAYRNAINLSDTYAETHYNLANMYKEKGEFKNAENEYRRSLQINPYFYHSYIQLYAIYKQQQNNQGIQDIEKSLKKLGEKNSEYNKLLDILRNNY